MNGRGFLQPIARSKIGLCKGREGAFYDNFGKMVAREKRRSTKQKNLEGKIGRNSMEG